MALTSAARPLGVAPVAPRRGQGKRITWADRVRLLELHREHPAWSCRQLALAANVHHETARLAILAVAQRTSDLMAACALARLTDWRRASRAAARRGDHRPARDWLLHANVIDPLPDPSRGSGAPIVIVNHPLPGMPASPVPIDARQNPAAPPAGDDDSSA